MKEEMDLLQLYIELESLRFKDAFSYSIDCDEGIDQDDVFVPALMLQPLVENAIWHGLMHKEGQRLLLVQFSMIDKDRLLCRIERQRCGEAVSATERQCV